MSETLNDWRRDYEDEAPLLEQDLSTDPIAQFDRWLQEASQAEMIEPNAMTLATTAADGTPDARIVLLKEFDADGFVFYTNYQSAKAAQLRDNPLATLLFYWDKLGRTVRITGMVTKVGREMSEQYFATRPRKSQIGAWVSDQSQPVVDRDTLRARFEALAEQYEGQDVPCPSHWGGYRVRPRSIEFWQGQRSRMHDRLLYTKQDDGTWSLQRLAP